MIIQDERIISMISPNDGSKGEMEPNDNMVEHQTYGSEGGDLSVGLYGVGFHWYITKDGRIFQLWDTNSVCWHCNGANRRAMGVEYESHNGEGLTPEQIEAGAYLHALLGRLGIITLSYVDPDSVAWASIHVNGDYGFHGCLSHRTVMTDDGSSQHSDLITEEEWTAMMGSQPGRPLPAPFITPTQQEPLMHRTIMVNGMLDIFTIDDKDTLWWHHVGDATHKELTLAVSKNADSRYPDIDVMPTQFGPIITARQKVVPGDPPKFMRVIIKGYIYAAETI